MSKGKQKFLQFMQGRYGTDALNRFLLALSLIFLLLGTMLDISVLRTLVIAILVYIYYRMFSKNIPARYKENQKFLSIISPIKSKLYIAMARIRDRKTYVYLKCPECGTALRLPKGKGTLRVHCPDCNHVFEKKT